MGDVLRSWLPVIRRRQPTAEQPSREVIEITCHLRGTAPGLPSKFRYGVLSVAQDGVTWRPYFGRAKVISVQRFASVDEVRRPGGPGEWNIKSRLFKVVRVSGSDGSAELAVPTGDVQRVRAAVTWSSD